jgi:hexosaminidase
VLVAEFGLVPLPSVVRASPGAAPFRLDAGVAIAGDPAAVSELLALVLERTGLKLPSNPGGSVRLHLTGTGPAASYRLAVSAASIDLEAPDAAGLFYGVQTLSQLLANEDGTWVIPAVEIEDAPRFAYRGVMLDVARHFFDVDVVKAWIDRATSLKCNHLHLHLSDDQGWRLELASRPELTARASASAIGGDRGGFYTATDYAEIVAYAASRHMTVVPEIDVPGHTHAVGLAYPELAADPVLTDGVREAAALFGGGLPVAGEGYTGLAVGFSSLRTGAPEVDAFLSDVFAELAAMTPGPYLHLGGDEAHGTDPADFAAFLRRAIEIVAATGKTPMAWHEAGAAAPLSTAVVGQYWDFVEPDDTAARNARAIVEGGGAIVLSPADAVYLDMKPDAKASLGLTWANGPTSVQRAYDWEPAEVLAGVPETAILGVEAPLWTETVRTLADIDALAFPRLAAAAEIAWSAPRGAAPERTWASFRGRVGALGPLWASRGIGFSRSSEIAWADA